MTKIYNKGYFRCREWAKHLRPFLKKQGNRRWRKYAEDEINHELYDSVKTAGITKQRQRSKVVKVKFVIRGFGETTYRFSSKYRTLKAAKDAISRNNVVKAEIVS